MTTYLDWNATSPPHPDVLDAMRVAHEASWGNPSSVHAAGRVARDKVETCREQVAALLEVSPRDVVFTSGGTEGNHLAMSGARWLVVGEGEHASVTNQAEALKEGGAWLEKAKIDSDGVIEPGAVEDALSRLYQAGGLTPNPFAGQSDSGGVSNENTPLVCILAASHETGALQPIRDISGVVRRYGARLHVDAVQLLGRGDLEQLHFADSITVCSHKIRGPKGVGVLAFNGGFSPIPLSRGGAQERGLRPGTVDAAGVWGFQAALSRLNASREGYRSAGILAQELLEHLERASRVTLHGAVVPRLPHVVNFRVEGFRGDELVAALDLHGVCVSSGSACSAGTSEPSPTITAMLGSEAAVGAVRVSFGETSTHRDLKALLSALSQLGVTEAP